MIFKIDAIIFDNFHVSRVIPADTPEELSAAVSELLHDFWDDMPETYGPGFVMSLNIERKPDHEPDLHYNGRRPLDPEQNHDK